MGRRKEKKMTIYLWIFINRISLLVDIKWNGGNLVLGLNKWGYRSVSRPGGFPFYLIQSK
jgi:hypothetical protein